MPEPSGPTDTIDTGTLVVDWAYAYAIDSLDGDERAAVESAVAKADPEIASRFADAVREVHEVMALMSATTAIDAPASLRSALFAEVGLNETETGETSQDGHAVNRGAAVASLDERRRRYRVRAIAAAAAVVAVATGAVVVGSLNSDSPNSDTAPVIASGKEASPDAVLSAPDVKLASAAVTGGGIATVAWSRRTDAVVVTLDGLSAPAPGRVFALWLIDEGSAPRPVGLVAPAQTAPFVVTALGSAGTFAISVEAAAGASAPTATPITALTLT